MPPDGNRRLTKKSPARPVARDTGRALFGGHAGTNHELAQLQQQIRDNERIWAGFREIEIRMIGARSLRELVSVLVTEIRRCFGSVDCATLACFDPEYELTRLLEGEELDDPNDRPKPELDVPASFINVTYDSLSRLFPPPHRPRLGLCEPALQRLLFPAFPRALGSVALAPLLLRGQLVGTLNQASRDPAHFTPSTATDLLEHLAAVTAMCLDNAVNRERLRRYGLMDPLTGIPNRRLFERRLSEEVDRWYRRQEPLVYMLVDIDHFKQVNDRHGHQAGDRVLQQVAELLGRDLRAADVLARYGGEEFVMLLPSTTLRQGAAIAQRLCSSVARHKFGLPDGQSLAVTVSIGVACLNADSAIDGQAPGGWLYQYADAALYQAKQSGRNRVVAG